MANIEIIRSSLDRFEPDLKNQPVARRAAVALVLRDGPGNLPEVLFIERARNEGDPWSGHMAFPGGRVDPEDAHVQAAAERETAEEVGVSLAGASCLGRLDDLQGRHAGRPREMVISGFVFHHPTPDPLVVDSSEVETAFWFPLAELANPDRHVERSFPETGTWVFPGIIVGDPDRHVVWGLTYRFLEVFHRALGSPFPNRWQGLTGDSE